MKTLYIHIGTHKTGTTAIQNVLYANQKILSNNHDLFVIPISQLYNEMAPIRNLEQYNENIVESVKKYFKYFIKNSSTSRLLLSWEGLSGNMEKAYSNVKTVAAMLFAITKNIDRVKIIIYLRSQDDLIESMYKQIIHGGVDLKFKDFFIKLPVEYLAYDEYLKNFETNFGGKNLIVRRYCKQYFAKRNSNLIEDFFSIFKIDTSKLMLSTKESNVSYSENSLSLATLVNPFLTEDEKPKLRKILQSKDHLMHSQPYSLLSADEKKKLMLYFQTSNDNIAKKYFFGDILFYPPDNFEKIPNVTLLSNIDKCVISLTKTAIHQEDLLQKIFELLTFKLHK